MRKSPTGKGTGMKMKSTKKKKAGTKRIGKSIMAWLLAVVIAVPSLSGSLHTNVLAAQYDTESIGIDAAEAEGNAEPEGEIKEQGEAESVERTEEQPATEAQSETEVQPETKTQSETEVQPETEIQSETDAEPETEIQGETETQPESEEAESEESIESETEIEIETETETATENETEIETETETEAETQTEEWELQAIEGFTLNNEQLADRQKLKSSLSEIKDLREGVDYVAGELVFLAQSLEEAQQIAAGYGSQLKNFADGVGVITLPDDKSVESMLQKVTEAGNIALPTAWPNYIYSAFAEDPFLNVGGGSYQWQHVMLGTAYAWAQGYTGEGIKIAVLDSGINEHEDLEVAESYNYSPVTGTADTADGGHGTQVAGLIAAKRGNGAGGAGIAPEAGLVNIKVLNEKKKGTSEAVLKGLNKAIETGVDIINLSFGESSYDGNCANLIKAAYDKGILVLAAAGNDGSKTMCYPACYTGAYAIGAVQKNKGKTALSNYGTWVKYSAPGEHLWSTANNGEYASITGTSAATAVMSGTAAVVLSADKTLQEKTGEDKVKALIKKMDSGKTAGNGGAASIVYLPKVLGIAVSTANPGAPSFSRENATFTQETVSLEIYAKSALDTVYYSLDGKNPTYKNGVLSGNAIEYTGAFEIGNKSKEVVKAISIDMNGKVSKVVSATYNFKPLVTDISISGNTRVIINGSTNLTANVTPSFAGKKEVKWSSNDSAVKVDAKGKVTATKKAEAGREYMITATAKDGSGISKRIFVMVSDKPLIESVSFTKKSDTITRAGTDIMYSMAAILQVKKVSGGTGTVADVSFTSSNTKVATVSNESGAGKGQVKVLAPGKTVITATATDGSKKKASFTLQVKQSATRISIDGLSEISKGKTVQMKATVSPVNLTTKGVTWKVSPENKGVTVDKNGKVKVAKEATKGAYTITATAKDGSGIAAEKTITVIEKEITKITLSSKNIKIFRVQGNYSSYTQEGMNTAKISAVVDAKTTSGISVSADAYEFISSNPGVATVEQKGSVATVKATGTVTGSTKITCRALDGSGKTATCTVTVCNPPSAISIVPPAGSNGYIGVGKKLKLSAVLEEEYGKVSSKKVVWSSSDESVATVDKSGNVKGILEGGAAKITVKLADNDRICATYMVAVRKAIKSVALDCYPAKGTLTLGVNKVLEGKVLYNGKLFSAADNNVYPRVAIEISNPNCLAVESTGLESVKLRGKKNGTVTVTIKALDGSGVKKNYKVTVK